MGKNFDLLMKEDILTFSIIEKLIYIQFSK